MQPSARGRLRAADVCDVEFAGNHVHQKQRLRAADVCDVEFAGNHVHQKQRLRAADVCDVEFAGSHVHPKQRLRTADPWIEYDSRPSTKEELRAAAVSRGTENEKCPFSIGRAQKRWLTVESRIRNSRGGPSNDEPPRSVSGDPIGSRDCYTSPWASMALATFMKPPMLAPTT